MSKRKREESVSEPVKRQKLDDEKTPEKLYRHASDAAAENNTEAIRYFEANNRIFFFMICMIMRFGMLQDLKIPPCNPSIVTGVEANIPKHPITLLEEHLFSIYRAREDKAEALRDLMSRKNVVGGNRGVRRPPAKPAAMEDFEEDRHLSERSHGDEDFDDDPAEFL